MCLLKKLFILSFLASSLLFAEDTLLEKQAKQIGFTSCLSSIKKLETFLTKNVPYGSYSAVAKKNPNNEVYTATLELTYKNSPALVDLTIFPNSEDGTCSFNYTRTWYEPRTCSELSKHNTFKDFKFLGTLNKRIDAYQKGSSVKMFFSNAGDGCLVQKKETIYRWAKQD